MIYVLMELEDVCFPFKFVNSLVLYAFFFPVCAMASARTAFDGSNHCMNCCCASPALLRNIVREGYHIEVR